MDYIDAEYWRTDSDRYMPSMRRIDQGHSYDPNAANFRTRKGVQVHYSVDVFTLTQPRRDVPTKQPARKARWPYMGKC